MSHTPGPWELLNDRSIVSGNVLIAQTSRVTDRHQADACLIATAPEMLEALESVAVAFNALVDYETSLESLATNDIDAQKHRIRASTYRTDSIQIMRIIAKARGAE